MTRTLPSAPGDAPPPPPRRSRGRDLLAIARNVWRGLTSMRTALRLLFLLAVAALPGALLPQRTPSPRAVDEYFRAHPTLAPLLDKVGVFDLFATPWFAAIYLLLFVSLLGCLIPRTVEQLRGIRTPPVVVPRNLSRLPHHAAGTTADTPDEVVDRARRRLAGRLGTGWHLAVRSEPGGVRTLSAEKGGLREVGNLVFHISLVVLLLGIAGGKLFGYEGSVTVLADGSSFCNSGVYAFDDFRPGLEVDGTTLDPFCVDVDAFHASYRPGGEPDSFSADVHYQDADALAAGVPAGQGTSQTVAVNEPLRFDGLRVYLLGHGYAPRFTVTFPDGQQRTGVQPWQPMDQQTFLSQGATKIDPPGVTDEATRRTRQLALAGLFAPTATGGHVLSSSYPAPEAPAVALDVLRGDLGLDSGRSQAVSGIDQSMVAQHRLTRIARQNLTPGQSIRLDDGTQVRFDGPEQWVNLQVSRDPAQEAVLGSAVALLVGLTLSLTIKRRRFWVRAGPTALSTTDGRTVTSTTTVAFGGLARTDQAGYGEEFVRLVRELGGPEPDTGSTVRPAPGRGGEASDPPNERPEDDGGLPPTSPEAEATASGAHDGSAATRSSTRDEGEDRR